MVLERGKKYFLTFLIAASSLYATLIMDRDKNFTAVRSYVFDSDEWNGDTREYNSEKINP